ncbi:MOXD1 homolog 1 [Drosophila subpulchrella]|uniref:MOXD1 homolog 1 n=1 Tax=Drosophila subpulchrella TaxID=1486046 RepID=UPI0018A1966B|nr:MOXD1 homolog 1 [Drosophila subpulchrella]
MYTRNSYCLQKLKKMSFQNVLWIVLTAQLSLGYGYFENNLRHEDYDVDTNGPVHHKNWIRNERMDNNGLYWLKWWINATENTIYFEVTVHTRGFAGLGFSKDGRVARADMVLLWVDDTTEQANALDCHGAQDPSSGPPVQDDTQNYDIIDGYQNSTHTNVRFKRKIETCDPFDIPFSADTFKVLWSMGDSDPLHRSLEWHGQSRGVKSLRLFSPMFTKHSRSSNSKTFDMSDIQKWDITVNNVTIQRSMDTLYWCKIVQLPELTKKQHIIGYEPLLSGKHDRNIVHHMTLFECQSKSYPGSDPSSWDIWVRSSGTVCNSNLLTPRDWDSCSTPVAVWSLGSDGQFMPPHAGIPMGGASGVKYYMLEIHYDNPHGKLFVDHSGFRIHYTQNLRTYDAGILINGVSISETQLIPPGQKKYRNVGICGPSCSSVMFPEDGIKVISGTLHSHQAGRQISLRHIRSGKELNPIIVDENYDYRHQKVHQLANETVVLPGDYLITDCSYDTKLRKRPTFGGYSTKEEMCLTFITYYPRIELSGCYSMTPVREFFEMFGVYQFYSLNMTDIENMFLYSGDYVDYSTNTRNTTTKPKYGKTSNEDVIYQESLLNKLVISEPPEFHDRTFLAHLNQLPWYEPLFTKRVEQEFITGKHMTFCRVSNESISIPSEIIRFPDFTAFVKPPTACLNYFFTDNEELRSGGSRHLTDFTFSLLLFEIGLRKIVL